MELSEDELLAKLVIDEDDGVELMPFQDRGAECSIALEGVAESQEVIESRDTGART